MAQPTLTNRLGFDRSGVLARSVVALCCIIVLVWLAYHWTGYARRYAYLADGLHMGGSQLVEVTLIREDRTNLMCASDAAVQGLHCQFTANGAAVTVADPRLALQPYKTTTDELLLGAGLWQSPPLDRPLPPSRFTVVCNYHLIGALRSVSLRWRPAEPFDRSSRALPVGTLSDCVIPE